MASHCHGLLRCLWWSPLWLRYDDVPAAQCVKMLTDFEDTGTISGILAMPYWQRLFSTGYIDPNGDPNITTAQESTIVSILSAGTFFGALSTALFSDYLGRRPGLIIACWIFNLGVVLQTIATAIPMFSAGRFFAGFGVGLVSAMSMPPAATIFASCH